METYPPEFVIHLQPTLVVTGLTTTEDASHQNRTGSQSHVSVDTPPPPPPRHVTASGLEAQKAALLQAMLSRNNVTYWDNTKGLAGSLFYVVPEHRSYILPPTRKSLQQTGQQHLQPSLSPSSPSSPLYPDGLISPLWIRRHRDQIPSVFVAVVDLWDRESIVDFSEGNHQRVFSDKGPLGVVDPLEREHDTVLAQELLERRKAAQERLVKFAVVILLQRSHMEDPSIEDRLNFVRKSAGLDIKNSFYVLQPSSSQEISDFAVNLQRSQYEGSMSYYKEQVKRHKKKKSNLPSTTASVKPPQQIAGGSQQQPPHQGLSVQGWMLRYDFKMGMFSECKQDIDNAVKHYESAYGLLIDMFAVTSTITPGAPGLQARTKRWAEAKVLADCLCLKICKFHLYLDAPSTALFTFRRHLIVFKAFSESWRMGDDSFEYWAWLGKQYKVFGDLIDIGTKLGFKLPVPSPSSIVYGSFAGMAEGAKDLNKFSGINLGSSTVGFGIGPSGDAFVYNGNVGAGRGGGTHGPGAGINPMLILQHAGYFYHQAANCSAYPDSNVAPIPTTSKPFPPTLQSMNAERAIDHLALTIELLTKSYEQFKRYKAGRMTLFLASEIAGTYYSAGRFEMALKFFERIGKTYRKEGWNLILTSILKWSVQCAKELGYWENVVEYLIEMMSPDMPSTDEKRNTIFEELVSIIYTGDHPANAMVHRPLVLNMHHYNPFVTCEVQFQRQQAFVSSESRFQVQISTQGGEGALPSPFRISFVHVEFSDEALNHHFVDTRSHTSATAPENASRILQTKDRTGKSIEWVDCAQCTWEHIDSINSGSGSASAMGAWKKVVDLDIRPSETKVFEGAIAPTKEQVVVKVTLGIITKHWNVSLEYPSLEMALEQDPSLSQSQPMPPRRELPSRQWLDVQMPTADIPLGMRFKNLDKGIRRAAALRIVPRESKVEIKALFKSPAYLDEYFPIKIKVRNGEAYAVAMEMDVELRPIDPTIESLDSIVLDPYVAAAQPFSADRTQASSTLNRISLTPSDMSHEMKSQEMREIDVGAWAERTVFVRALEIPTPRTILCKVRYELSLDKENNKTWTEKRYSFRVLFIPPFDAEASYTQLPVQTLGNNSSNSQGRHKNLPPILEPNRMDEKHETILIPALTHKETYLMSTRINNEGSWPVEVKEVTLVTNSTVESALDGAVKESVTNGLSRSLSIGRARERKKSLQEVGVYVDLLECGPSSIEQLTSNDKDKNGSVQRWRPGNIQTLNHLIQITAADLELAPEQINVGFLQISWRRWEDEVIKNVPYTTTNVPLQPLTLPKAEVYMTVDLPKHARVNKPFTVRYVVHNPTNRLHELSMSIESSEGMVYAGTMQTAIKLLPYATHPIQMSCYPLSAGLTKLPRVKLVVNKRKLSGRRGRPAPLTPQQEQSSQEEMLVKIRDATRTSETVGASAVSIFVKPEMGLMK
ncbi:Gryzun, putative trafficking through golgi-domain-containing protein [Lobosporangium transversale]|uniref:Gryzun, putative trafficking through golgi-domain-containing protein n=1 Tax=Lobosporangium transversale TaxID=64571 RepID=A0A1Y2GSS0_9FUNG|nr:Gryzun, putative trafficking through golgi-domain-containing protein [Lobosporangium transversale]ORZ16695.1 Gryzun, putative trafficking through golgi-domain-containing protein [Lobosporangium transversale]|eukprot:XP_021881630.1 Gryzun, putative trafficking through golgi-domain-containing protein [Lobosporangium transversale]